MNAAIMDALTDLVNLARRPSSTPDVIQASGDRLFKAIDSYTAEHIRLERERCAQVAEAEAVPAKAALAGIPDRQWAAELQAEIEMAMGIAAAIRALP